jgi:hypothetical protein
LIKFDLKKLRKRVTINKQIKTCFKEKRQLLICFYQKLVIITQKPHKNDPNLIFFERKTIKLALKTHVLSETNRKHINYNRLYTSLDQEPSKSRLETSAKAQKCND